MHRLSVLAAAGLFFATVPFAASAAPVSQGQGLIGAAGQTAVIQNVQHERAWSRRRHWRAGSGRGGHWRWGSGDGHRRWGSSDGHGRWSSARRHSRWGSRRD